MVRSWTAAFELPLLPSAGDDDENPCENQDHMISVEAVQISAPVSCTNVWLVKVVQLTGVLSSFKHVEHTRRACLSYSCSSGHLVGIWSGQQLRQQGVQLFVF